MIFVFLISAYIFFCFLQLVSLVTIHGALIANRYYSTYWPVQHCLLRAYFNLNFQYWQRELCKASCVHISGRCQKAFLGCDIRYVQA